MAEEAFSVEVFTPGGLILSEEATAVQVPSSMGEIGILPRHVNYLGLLGTGVMELATTSKGRRRLVISGGFCNFSDGALKIITDSVDLPESINSEAYAKDRKGLQALITQKAYDDPEAVTAREKLARIEALDRLISN